MHAERDNVRRSGRSAGRVGVVSVRVHDVISGRRMRLHGRGGSEVLARDGVGLAGDRVDVSCVDSHVRV